MTTADNRLAAVGPVVAEAEVEAKPETAGIGATPLGYLIAFEGAERVGKSTQARLLAEHLGAVLTFEPGATELGKEIRSLVLGKSGPPVSPRAEALLMAADRAQHVAEVILPALDLGTHVVTDRYVGSSLAYQGYGRALGLGEVDQLSCFATDYLDGDLVIVLEVPDEAARKRQTSPDDRIEAEAAEFHRRVAEGYRELAGANQRWVSIDGNRPTGNVAKEVRRVVNERLGI